MATLRLHLPGTIEIHPIEIALALLGELRSFVAAAVLRQAAHGIQQTQGRPHGDFGILQDLTSFLAHPFGLSSQFLVVFRAQGLTEQLLVHPVQGIGPVFHDVLEGARRGFRFAGKTAVGKEEQQRPEPKKESK